MECPGFGQRRPVTVDFGSPVDQHSAVLHERHSIAEHVPRGGHEIDVLLEIQECGALRYGGPCGQPATMGGQFPEPATSRIFPVWSSAA